MGAKIIADIKVERLSSFINELKPLLEKHYKEVHVYRKVVDFNPDYETYLSLDEAGVLHCVTARVDGKLVGYFISTVSASLHYMDHKYAVNDVVYIDKGLRGSNLAYDMISFAENEYKKMGVSVYTLHIKTAIPCEKLMNSLELKKIESIYSKYIGG